MTEVQKVSIGGYAFTLEVEAYAIVRQYLEELESYYSRREGGTEVMEGFEERMAELLYEKCADDGVANVEEVKEIISILGKPSAIESDDDSQPDVLSANEQKPRKGKDKKRLYRDPTGKVIGGVCSGLAAYFRMDVVIIRIIFIGLVLFGMFTNHFHFSLIDNLPPFVILVYLALWIAMPKAKTVQQRWELGITNPPAGGRAVDGKPVGSGLGRVLRIIIGATLVIVAVTGLTAGLAAIFGHKLLGIDFMAEAWDEIRYEAPRFIPLLGSYAYRIVLLAVGFLPLVGMLYGGVMLIFDFKTPSWRPGMVIFLLWVIALVAFIVLTMMAAFDWRWYW